MPQRGSGDGRMGGSPKHTNYLNEIAEFVHDIRYEDIPSSLSRKILLHILDTLAVGLLGADTDLSIKSRNVFPTHTSRLSHNMSPLWGTHEWADPSISAFNNAVAAHALELDDSHGCDHSGAIVVPAAMATIGIRSCSPNLAELVVATVVGYEVSRRMQTALGGYRALNDRGWHSTAVCGPFAATAASARLLRLSKSQHAAALSLTTSTAAGTWAFSSGGGDAKTLHAGLASKAGVDSALFAKEGLQGSRDVFRDVWGGFLGLYGGRKEDTDHLIKDLGTDWVAYNSRIKFYSSCASVHPTLATFQKFWLNHSHTFASEPVKIEVLVSASVSRMCGNNVFEHLNDRTARQLSLPYSLALVILKDQPELSDYIAPRIDTAKVKDVLNKIRVVPDAKNFDASGHGSILIETENEKYVLDTKTASSLYASTDVEDRVVQKVEWIGHQLNRQAKLEKLTDLYLNSNENDSFLQDTFVLLQ